MGWSVNGNSLSQEVSLKPGESKKLTVVLDWAPTEDNLGTKINTVRLENILNEANFDEKSTIDNSASADLVVSVNTGKESWSVLEFTSFIALILSAGVCVVYLKKKSEA